MEFQVTKGKKETGYVDGIRIKSSTHNIVIRTGSVHLAQEWVSAISQAFGKSEFRVKSARYDSSFLIRHFNTCQWYVDAQDYYADVYKELKKAKNYVYITDWWLSPDLYLKRPKQEHPDSQLVELLGKLADKGVKIYVHLFKEISLSLSLNSLYSKQRLIQRSTNIFVMRHPNISIKGGVFLWSHHQKSIVVDGQIAFMGGLDLCYGRFDNRNHSLVDTQKPYTWNDIDYSNVRIADFTEVDKWERSIINRKEVPRMPWHDIAMSVKGAVVRDIAFHFRDLWNHAVKDITGSKDTNIIIPLHDTSPMQRYQSMIKPIISKKEATHVSPADVRIEVPDNFKKSFQNSLVDYVQKSNRPKTLYIDPQSLEKQVSQNMEAEIDQVEIPLLQQHKSGQYLKSSKIFKIFSKMVEQSFVPYPHLLVKKVSNIQSKIKEKTQMDQQDQSQTHNQLVSALAGGVKVMIEDQIRLNQQVQGGSCKCQLLRSAGLWSIGRVDTQHSVLNAYLWQIAQAKHFIYIQNQFFVSNTCGKPVKNSIAQALVDRIKAAYNQDQAFKIIVVLPLLPGFQGSVDDPGAAVLRVQLHYQYQTISRSSSSIYQQLVNSIPNPEDYIRFYGVRNHGVLKGNPVTEMVYVHSKLMIVDDRVVIMGSANINDRSMLGKRDSELAMIVEDVKNQVQTRMGGEPFTANLFAHSLRMRIFEQFSGEVNHDLLKDPFSPEFYQVWERQARRNTRFYRQVFACYPDDHIKTLNKMKKFQEKADYSLYEEKVRSVKGFIVQFPLLFLEDEDLKLSVSNKEYFLPDITFTQ